MSDNNAPQSNHPQHEDSQHSPAADLAAELREMGQQIEAALRAAVESDRAKQIQHDLTNGMRELTKQLQGMVKQIQENPQVQQAEDRGRQALTQAKASKFVQDLEEAVANGFSQLNDRLRKLVDRLEGDRTSEAGTAPTQQVPVEHEPATGSTTRLDE